MAVPKEPREYVSILKGVAGGAETAPALATVLLGTTSRSSNPRCNPNERCSPFPYPVSHPLGPTRPPRVLPFRLVYLVLPPSQRGSRSRPIKTLYDHVVQHSVRRFVFLFFGSSRFFASSSSSFSFCSSSPLSPPPAPPFSSHDLIVPCSSPSPSLSIFFSVSCSLYSFFSHFHLVNTRIRDHRKTSSFDNSRLGSNGGITMIRFEILICRYEEQVS